MPKPIVAQQQPIHQIFSSAYVFSVPPYQRPYAWTTEQTAELLDDLQAFMNAEPAGIEEMPPYFLGSIVLIKSESSPEADVIDGQQRLTTLTILFAVIRHLLDATLAQSFTDLIYEKASPIIGHPDRFRLTLRERDAEFFRKNIQREGGLAGLLGNKAPLQDSKLRIKENASLLHSRLATLTAKQLLDLAKFVATRCYLVAVSTPDIDSAYRIFSVMNSRGLELTATDILKAELIGSLPAHQRSAYTNKWETIEEDLGRDAFNDLFSHIRMVHRKSKPQGTLLKEFRDHVVTGRTAQTVIDSIIEPMAAAYEVIVDAAYQSTENAAEINNSLRWLNRLEFTDWIPPALAFLSSKEQKPSDVLRFVWSLERLGYYMLVCRLGVNERIERFAKISQAVETASVFAETGSPLDLSPNEKKQFYEALDGDVYGRLSARACGTLLLRLDSLVAGEGAVYESSVITVEHVLPQNPPPQSQWLEWFADPASRAFWTNRIGNLALLSRKKNSAASNYDFTTKKIKYFMHKGAVSPFKLTTQVLGVTEWTTKTVQTRHADLMALMDAHWRLEGRGAKSSMPPTPES